VLGKVLYDKIDSCFFVIFLGEKIGIWNSVKYQRQKNILFLKKANKSKNTFYN